MTATLEKEEILTEIPRKGISQKELVPKLRRWSEYEKSLWNGEKFFSSGAVYHGQKDLIDLQTITFGLFSVSNPLHPECHPYLIKMMTETIAMTISYFNGNPYKQCGMITSGGTESIILAIRAYKKKFEQIKNIKMPELIISRTAHAAFIKACEMWDVKAVIVNPDENTLSLTAKDVEKFITKNTIAIVGSSVEYSHGVQDEIGQLAKLALKHNIGFHVDCCLGSFLLPTVYAMKEFDYYKNIKPFDWTVKGITTISCDTHKFGYTVKGTSILMFCNTNIRKYAYFFASQTNIGLYGTPTIAGSRSGGNIACAYSALVSMGKDGYKRDAIDIMNAVDIIKKAIKEELNKFIEIVGNPCLCIVSWKSKLKNVHVYAFSKQMKEFGWLLNNCTKPDCTHICVTKANCHAAKKFVSDLKKSCQLVVRNSTQAQKSSTAIYGAVGDYSTNDANKLIIQFIDALSDLPQTKSKL